jgi:hypothetical protein
MFVCNTRLYCNTMLRRPPTTLGLSSADLRLHQSQPKTPPTDSQKPKRRIPVYERIARS